MYECPSKVVLGTLRMFCAGQAQSSKSLVLRFGLTHVSTDEHVNR
jgi:hypothetical protein